uniref:Uncharacterized protein n=1 Tax=Oryza rufipogon TaxID=4529 RepID=A0A0E0MVW1_ORYRU
MVQVNKKILVEQQRFSSYPSSSPFVLNVLEEAISGTDTLRSLPVGSSAAGKLLFFEQEIDGGYGLAPQMC